MKLLDIKEMAIRGGDMQKQALQYVEANKDKWKNAPYIADMDSMKIRKLDTVYSVWDGDDLVVTASASPKNEDTIIDDIWVSPKYRGQKFLVKLLLFFRSRENMTKLVLGNVHTDDTYAILKNGGLKFFKKTWKNKYETKPFSIETIDDFYKAGNWELVLENKNFDFTGFEKFNGVGFTKTSYDILFNIFALNEHFED